MRLESDRTPALLAALLDGRLDAGARDALLVRVAAPGRAWLLEALADAIAVLGVIDASERVRRPGGGSRPARART